MIAPGLDWHREDDGSERAAYGWLHLYVWHESGQWWAQVEDAASVLLCMREFPDQATAAVACRFFARGYCARDDLVSLIDAEAFVYETKGRERVAAVAPLSGPTQEGRQ